jgi:hypothetical protein
MLHVLQRQFINFSFLFAVWLQEIVIAQYCVRERPLWLPVCCVTWITLCCQCLEPHRKGWVGAIHIPIFIKNKMYHTHQRCLYFVCRCILQSVWTWSEVGACTYVVGLPTFPRTTWSPFSWQFTGLSFLWHCCRFGILALLPIFVRMRMGVHLLMEGWCFGQDQVYCAKSGSCANYEVFFNLLLLCRLRIDLVCLSR